MDLECEHKGFGECQICEYRGSKICAYHSEWWVESPSRELQKGKFGNKNEWEQMIWELARVCREV